MDRPAPGNRDDVEIRVVRASDDAALSRLLRQVMAAAGVSGPGSPREDPEIDGMSAAYAGERAVYHVAESNGELLGGAGIAPLAGGGQGVCELRKMYLRPEARGRGIGRRLLQECLRAARSAGFARCYLETSASMATARALYESSGFERLDAPLGNTGHGACEQWYALTL